MSKIENELQHRFGDEQLPNDGFDTVELWDAIASDLDPEVVAPFWLSNIRTIGLTLALVAIAGVSILYTFSGSTSFQLTQEDIVTDYNNSNKKTSQNASTVQQVASKESTDNNTATQSLITAQSADKSATTQVPSLQQNKEILNSKKANANPTINTVLNYNSVSSTPIAQTTTQQKSANLPLLTNLTQNTHAASELTKLASTAVSSNASQRESSLLSPAQPSTAGLITLANAISQLKANPLTNNIILPEVSIDDIYIKKLSNNNETKWSASLIGGANMLRLNYASSQYPDLANTKSNSESAYLGTTLGFNTGVLLNDIWTINTGIEYHQLWSKFDRVNVSSGQVNKVDEILKIVLNSSTGDTINIIRGDTLVNATFTQRVQHFNSFKRLSIPLEFGFRKQVDKVFYGLKVGAVFNLTLGQSGKGLNNNGDIVLFAKDDTNSPLQPSDISLRLSPIIGYKLTDNLAISMTPQWMWTGKTSQAAFDVNIHQFNLNLGLQYGF